MQELCAGYDSDPDFAHPQATLGRGDYRLLHFQVPAETVREVIPSLMHDAAWSGHVGYTQTLKLNKRLFWWQSLCIATPVVPSVMLADNRGHVAHSLLHFQRLR
jgi:hypothetical protein